MKLVDGEKWLKIGEVARLINRSTLTIKNWYDWYSQQPEEYQKANPLPQVRRDLDDRGTRYFKANEVYLLLEFRNRLKYGELASYNREKWGKRGQRIKEKLRGSSNE